MKRILITILFSASAAAASCTAKDIAGDAASSSASAVIALWPEGVPGQRSDIGTERSQAGFTWNVNEPTLTMVRPADDRSNGTAVIIAGGGGYVSIATMREGHQYATWLSTLGVTSFVLKYRLPAYGRQAPLQDILRAVRLLRSRAAEFHIDPQRIGVMGSSAGGHLAASAGTLFDKPAGRTGAALDSVSARPDFMMLMYPVITMRTPLTHAGSRKALLGRSPSSDEITLMSLEDQVSAATPPTLLIHSQDDQIVPVENSILFHQALTRAKVASEMYVFERGGHGMAMREGMGTASLWPHRAEEWLRARSLLGLPGAQAK